MIKIVINFIIKLIKSKLIKTFSFYTTEYNQSLIGGMSSAQKPPSNWWYSEHQKPIAHVSAYTLRHSSLMVCVFDTNLRTLVTMSGF